MSDGDTSANLPSDGALSTVVALVEKQYEAEATVARLTQELKEAQEQLRQLSEVQLPDAMTTAGLKTFTTVEGIKVDVKDIIAASVPKERTELANQWLRDHGHGGLIKTVVKVQFGRGDEAKAQQVMKGLKDQGYDFHHESAVHYQTLQAWAKERLALEAKGEVPKADCVPEDLFGIWQGKRTKLTYTFPE